MSNKHSNLPLKIIRKEEHSKFKVSRRKDIANIRAKINKINNRKIINKSKSWFSKKMNRIDNSVV